MDRLLLGVIAVIGLHTAFVLYVANVRRVHENDAIARNAPTRPAPAQIVVKPPVVAEPQVGGEPSPPQNPPAAPVAAPVQVARSRSSRAGPIEDRGFRQRTHHRYTASAGRIPAFPGNTRAGSPVRSFSDRIIVYKIKASPPSPTLNAVVQSTRDETPKPKKSLVAKLQYIYKKPWDLIKAVGSKLR